MALKDTLLDMTQNILSSMNGDEVNSIGDSVEALQVAEEVRTAYYILLQELEMDHQKAAIQLESVSDTARPTHIRIPDNVLYFDWVKYNYRTDSKDIWTDLHYLSPEDFVRRSVNMASHDAILSVEDFSGAPLYVGTDENPKYYTTFDEEYLVFDSYNNTLDSSVQKAKTLCWGSVIPPFELTDSFIPRLRADLFPRLISEAKSSCFINFKQVSNSKEEQRSRRMITQLQNRAHRVKQKQSTSTSKYDYSRPGR